MKFFFYLIHNFISFFGFTGINILASSSNLTRIFEKLILSYFFIQEKLLIIQGGLF
jgi:hypothetical protein